jgi:hypothetical protein
MIEPTWFLLLLANNRAIKSYPALCVLHCMQIQAHPFNFCIRIIGYCPRHGSDAGSVEKTGAAVEPEIVKDSRMVCGIIARLRGLSFFLGNAP